MWPLSRLGESGVGLSEQAPNKVDSGDRGLCVGQGLRHRTDSGAEDREHPVPRKELQLLRGGSWESKQCPHRTLAEMLETRDGRGWVGSSCDWDTCVGITS